MPSAANVIAKLNSRRDPLADMDSQTGDQGGVTLTPHQQVAYDQIREFVGNDSSTGPFVAVLEGYAGTGKTTLVGKMVRELGYPLGREVAIAAPTNKAVSVLSRKIDVPGVEARTIHSLLGQTVSSDDNGQKSARQVRTPELERFDLIVMDECSMISSPMLRDIMEHRGPQTRILFVGDPAQLPPVGEAIESPVFRDIQLKFRLSEIVRQAADNPIIAMTMPIRQAIEEQRRVTLEEIAAVIPSGATQACILGGGMQNVQSIAAYEQHRGTDCRIVAFRNSRVHAYNAALHTALHGAGTGGLEFSPGERVMVQQEFRCLDGRRIYNGEELVFEGATKAQDELEHDAWHATFRRDDGSTVRAVIPTRSADIERAIKALWKRRRPLAARGRKDDAEARKEASAIVDEIQRLEDTFALLRHAYAITSHKSQGSTYHTVLVDWGDLSAMSSDFEFNRGLYVAASRASNHMAIIT